MTPPRRRPGRKPLDPTDPSVHVCVSLPSRQVDQLRLRAHAEHLTVPALVRRLLHRPPRNA
jgi:hypothetical protein